MKILAIRSRACCEPTVTTTSSGWARISSSAMTSQMRSRSPASPWAVQYCSAVAPCPAISWPIMSPTSSSGSAATYGEPPASDTISGRAATANSALISEATMPTARSAYWPT